MKYKQRVENTPLTPDLEVVGIGTGLGAKLRAVVKGGRIEEVIILEGGLQYQQNKTEIKVIPPGTGSKIDVGVRGLTVKYIWKIWKWSFTWNK